MLVTQMEITVWVKRVEVKEISIVSNGSKLIKNSKFYTRRTTC